MLIYVSTEVFFLLLSHGTLEDVELPKKRGNLWNERFINIPSQSSLLLFFLPFLTRWLSMCSSYGIPLLLLHVTIEGRPHSSARELRGDGLKITPKDGMKEIVEQPKQKEGQDFFQDSQNLNSNTTIHKECVFGVWFSADSHLNFSFRQKSKRRSYRSFVFWWRVSLCFGSARFEFMESFFCSWQILCA